MVAPITGPIAFTRRNGTPYGVGAKYEWGAGYTQVRPYNLPLPYQWTQRYIGVDDAWGTQSAYRNSQSPTMHGTRSPWRVEDFPSSLVTMATNRARAMFNDHVHGEWEALSSALLPASLYEGRKALEQGVARLNQGINLVQAIRHRNLPFLLDVLKDISSYRGPRPGPRRGRVSRNFWERQAKRAIDIRKAGGAFGDSMLEVMFGWIPIVSDIQATVELLSADFNQQQNAVEGRGTIRGETHTNLTWNSNTEFWRAHQEYWVKVKCGAKVRIDNPNLLLANRLGLVNPLSSGWEVTPWSFVVDYFVNVGEYLGSFTETLGISFTEPWTRTRYFAFREYYSCAVRKPYQPGTAVGGYTTGIALRAVRADTSLPSIKLSKKQFTWGKDYRRFVTSASLLLQRIK